MNTKQMRQILGLPQNDQTLAEWNALDGGIWAEDESTTVRLMSEFDSDFCESWTGEHCDECETEGPSFVAGQYLDIMTGEWETADSIGGMHISNWSIEIQSDGYVNDIMRATIDAYHAQFKNYSQLARIA